MPELQNPNVQIGIKSPTPTADVVFDGIYGALIIPAQARTTRKEYVDGKPTEVLNDPAKEFVEKRFAKAEEELAPLDQQTVTSDDMRAQLLDKVPKEGVFDKEGKPVEYAVRKEKAARSLDVFLNRAREMKREGEIDGLTAKSFFLCFNERKLELNLGLGYNDLVEKNDEPVPGVQAMNVYDEAIRNTFMSKGVDKGGYFHVNTTPIAEGLEHTKTRYYIFPKLNADPVKVIHLWTETLEELGLQDSVYYKVSVGLAHDYNSLVAYGTEKTDGDVQAALALFQSKCPPELLSESNLPATLPLAKGIGYGTEPAQFLKLLKYLGNEEASYNQYVVSIAELAMRRAAYDYTKRGLKPEQVSPKQLAASSKPYFAQFIKLSGIDPVTMRAA